MLNRAGACNRAGEIGQADDTPLQCKSSHREPTAVFGNIGSAARGGAGHYSSTAVAQSFLLVNPHKSFMNIRLSLTVLRESLSSVSFILSSDS